MIPYALFPTTLDMFRVFLQGVMNEFKHLHIRTAINSVKKVNFNTFVTYFQLLLSDTGG